MAPRICLQDILCPHFYEIRKSILRHISAYDAAKLERLGALSLGMNERARYLNPIRDLLWDTDKIQNLLGQGMRITLIGTDVPALDQRLSDTQRYLRRNKHHRRLQIYLLGTFPMQGTSKETLYEMMNFGITGASCRSRSIIDRIQLQKLQQSLLQDPEPGKEFIMSFGVPSLLNSRANAKGYWYQEKDIPDRTIDLRVYVPCFDDRMWDEIRLPPIDALHIAGGLSQALRTITQVFVHEQHMNKADLTQEGFRPLLAPRKRPLALRISVFVVSLI
ncbi:hypothetical protein IAQ61_004036 [Plenodomus lingam]|uniref:Predicted protein n=1 Tax=Leptosphaeria maculans (strain JN3 / isolate v23.1.3 / race Av1-4-5-6-7-8) TaxID=985895 RepID=E4ZWZ9_LEPMJ|nr:predicted protein [Plenodomus lingam JN3]KAH9873413.1 hypothetical protein IAQ61_004036 [Plenodomus lingam]CBX95209.1 predicted protein [Plenodomus lingam JN3]